MNIALYSVSKSEFFCFIFIKKEAKVGRFGESGSMPDIMNVLIIKRSEGE